MSGIKLVGGNENLSDKAVFKQQVEKFAQDHWGSFEQKGGKLSMTFSREMCGEGNLRLLLSELFAQGIAKGDPSVISHGFFDELSQDYPIDLSRDTSVRLGQDSDHMIIDIQPLKTEMAPV